MEYCRAITYASGSSFTATFRFLTPSQRSAIEVVYAYCRTLDDIADNATLDNRRAAEEELQQWRQRLAAIYRGDQVDHPIASALQQVIRNYPLQQIHLDAIIDGMLLDLTHQPFADYTALRHYLWCVAGAVGVMIATLLGYRQPRTLEYAATLGEAFQLTNILRDVGEDSANGRLYLPLDECQRFGVSRDDLAARHLTPAITALLQFQAERALALYQQAEALLPHEDRRSQRIGLLMAAIYRALLKKIIRTGYPVLSRRVRLSRLHKVALILTALGREWWATR
jgi:15-cis-phytoene synthase